MDDAEAMDVSGAADAPCLVDLPRDLLVHTLLHLPLPALLLRIARLSSSSTLCFTFIDQSFVSQEDLPSGSC